MLDGLTNMFKMHDDDDFDDDYEDYDDDFDEDYEDEKPSARKRLFTGSSKKDSVADEEVSYTAEKPRFASKSKVVPMKTQSARGLEVSDILLRVSSNGFLTGDSCYLIDSDIDNLLILGGVTETHVDNDFLQDRNLHC